MSILKLNKELDLKTKKSSNSQEETILRDDEEAGNKRNEDNDTDDGDEESEDDSLLELGEIAVLGSSKASLKYRSATSLNASRRSIYRSNKNKEAASDLPTSIKMLSSRRSLYESEKKDKLLLGDEEAMGPQDQQQQELTGFDMLAVQERRASVWQETRNCFLPFQGYAFGIASAFCFSMSHVIMRKTKWLNGSDHAFIRYNVSFIFLFIYMKYYKIRMFPKNKLKILFFRDLVGMYSLFLS